MRSSARLESEVSKDERLKVGEKRVKIKLKASCQVLRPGVMQLTSCFLVRIKGWQAHHPLCESIPLDKRSICNSLPRCGLGGRPLSGNIWTRGYWAGCIQAWVLPQVHRQHGRRDRGVHLLVSVGGIVNQVFPASL